MITDEVIRQRFAARRLAFGFVPIALLASLLLAADLLRTMTHNDVETDDRIATVIIACVLGTLLRPTAMIPTRAVLLGRLRVARSLGLAILTAILVVAFDIALTHVAWSRPFRIGPSVYAIGNTASVFLTMTLLVFAIAGGVETALLRVGRAPALLGATALWVFIIDGISVSLSQGFSGKCCSSKEYIIDFCVAISAGLAFSTIALITRSLLATTVCAILWAAAIPLL